MAAYLLADAGIDLSAGRNGEMGQVNTKTTCVLRFLHVSELIVLMKAAQLAAAVNSYTCNALPPHTVCSSTDCLGISDGSRVEHHMCVYTSRMVSIVGEKEQLSTYFTSLTAVQSTFKNWSVETLAMCRVG